jgi:enoyl-CoA hydratase
VSEPFIRLEDRDGVRVLVLSRGKANPIDAELAKELDAAAKEAERDDAVRAVVLTSASPSIFCGGFDLQVLGRAEPAVFDAFVSTFEGLFLDLFLLGKPLVAALTGHAIAGGAMLAAAADFRLAAEGNGTLALPETRLAMLVPHATVEAMRASLGERALARLVLSGEAITFAEAKELGALDRIVPKEALLDEAASFARRLGESPSEIYAGNKRYLREPAAERARAVLESGRGAFTHSWFSPEGQRRIAATLSRIK